MKYISVTQEVNQGDIRNPVLHLDIHDNHLQRANLRSFINHSGMRQRSPPESTLSGCVASMTGSLARDLPVCPVGGLLFPVPDWFPPDIPSFITEVVADPMLRCNRASMNLCLCETQ